MKRYFMIVMVCGLALGMVLGCAPTESQQQEEELDEAIHALERVLVRYLTIDPKGTAEDVVQVTNRVSSAWAGVVDAAEGLDVDISQVQARHDELVEATGEIPADTSAFDALAMIQPYIDELAEAVEELDEDLGLH